MRKKFFYLKVVLIGFILLSAKCVIFAEKDTFKQVEDFVQNIIKEAKIPGMSVIIVRGDGSQYIKGFGYADKKERVKVTSQTKFELASCSKSFTALAALQLEEKGLINLDDPLSNYFPGFYVSYKKQKYDITLWQLLNHTTGIPMHTISLIQEDSSKEALQNTVKQLVGIELVDVPGKRFVYATINYDVIGAVIEKVSGQSYEDYMREYIFKSLGLEHSDVGVKKTNRHDPHMATGYKIGFFAPREYRPPIYRGNNPAAYIVSNGEDIARWLKIQMGLLETDLSRLIQKSHTPNQSVIPDRDLVFYFMGWQIIRYRKNEIHHTGANPNFTSYIGFRPESKIGAAVLVNSNSPYTTIIGDRVLRMMCNEELGDIKPPENKIDAICSIFSVVLGLILLGMLIYLIFKMKGIISGEKKYDSITLKKVAKMVLAPLVTAPFYIGIYIFPVVIMNISWGTLIVWGPVSISILLKLFIALFILIYVIYCLSLHFPDRNIYRNTIPLVLMLNTVSGLAGMTILPIFMGSFFSTIPVGYILFYFGLALSINIVLSLIARRKMIYFSNDITLDMRVDLVKKILTTKYQKFEKLLDGRIITTLSNDVVTVTGVVGLFMQFVSNFVVVCAGLVYLSTISFIATALVILSAIALGIYYFWVSERAKVYLEEARTAQNIYTSFMNSMINGYKELSMHLKKKDEFREDLVDSCKKIRVTNIVANLKFLNSEIISGTLGTIIIGLFCILTPRLLTNINIFVLISLLIVILYLRGPIAALIGILPRLTGIRVSWGRIKKFNEDIDPLERSYTFKRFFTELDLPEKRALPDKKALPYICHDVETIEVEDVMFKYKDVAESERFEIGPINFELNKGEILFITGGNGSGKTTLIKVLAGLYETDKGTIRINGQEVGQTQLGEYYSAIFSDYHLFKKLYEIDVTNRDPEIKEYFQLLGLAGHVHLEGNSFSTIDLSGGQRKRLALIQCYLEDRSVFLFDEVAANQDPRFKNFIYKVLFPKMKEDGKIVIVCSHDDHYFNVADKLIKLDMGRIEREFEKEEILANSISNNFFKKNTQKVEK